MFEKFKDITDNELVLLYKKQRNDDVEFELISRYQRFSKKLARELFDKFNFLYQVEYEDIYCICLGALFSSIRSFYDNNSVFYCYWKTAAINEVTSYVSKFTNIHKSNIDDFFNLEEGVSYNSFLKEKAQNSEDEFIYSFNLDEILSNPKHNFVQKDVDVFRLYLAGYTIRDIVKLTNSTYSKVRYQIDSVRHKLANILFNQ